MFLVIALSSHHGHDALAVVLFAVIGWADYLDGFTARLTGQYSRLGALLDPLVDRLLVIAGMIVAWNFTLLPRWALAIVVARELFMLALSRYALRRGVELAINWPGRLGVAPDHGRALLRHGRRALAGADHALLRPRARADGHRALRPAGHTRAARAPSTSLKFSLNLGLGRVYWPLTTIPFGRGGSLFSWTRFPTSAR